ncbi:Mss4-like protein [Tribonema minus]|uniref:Peptide-methionine (R)-S-oxide reductase n=1 Tax=Tribonema minus TaxID=303371 RepID=A0A835YX10_9STRA|nr:Mss4-like protein [Tribonema minus]
MSKFPAPSQYPVAKSAEEWKSKLTPKEYGVLFNKDTERAGSGEYDKFYPKADEGHFACKACNNPLYSAEAKFNSGCGWPAFDKCYHGSVVTEVDNSWGRRVEILCAKCGGHLGHVFEGERMTPTNERHCVNSASVTFIKGEAPKDVEESKVL